MVQFHLNKENLLQLLNSSDNLYKNLEVYEENLNKASIIKLSIENIANQDIIASTYNKLLKDNPVILPFDNIYFDVKGAILPNLVNGKLEPQDVGAHIQPATFHIKGYKLITMLIQLYYTFNASLISRTYLAYADLSGMHIMPMSNKIAAQEGCKCYETNPFNNNLAFMTQIQRKTPCLGLDCGFAKASCSQPHSSCGSVMGDVDAISKLLKVIFAYVTLPSNFIVKVEDADKVYYIISDTAQLYDLKCGKEKAEIYGNTFTDGNNYELATKVDKIIVPDQSFTNKSKTYSIRNEQ